MTWRKVTIAQQLTKGVCSHCGETSDSLVGDTDKICSDCAQDISENMHADALRELYGDPAKRFP